jgi:cytochrome o ubiquinol oxidase subunit 1
MTMVIAIPTGVKIFNWLFTMYQGKIRFDSPMIWFMCFVATFTIGGVTGVMLAVPAIDFQVHNSMFLVAHFHNTIIGGVVFGFLAGITYWFPKVFGFRLHDKLGKISAYFWQVGFLLAFMPLYFLGLMGAVRRIDHYQDPAWQPFFIVSAVGVVAIGVGIAIFVLQLVVSIVQRKKLRDTTGDPWNGRTLEWSVPSPAPHYNFARTPTVSRIDEWWYQKQDGIKKLSKSDYADIHLPKNSSLGIAIGVATGLFGFALIWHMWLLAVMSLVACIGFVVYRGLQDDVEYKITAEELYEHDRKARA